MKLKFNFGDITYKTSPDKITIQVAKDCYIFMNSIESNEINIYFFKKFTSHFLGDFSIDRTKSLPKFKFSKFFDDGYQKKLKRLDTKDILICTEIVEKIDYLLLFYYMERVLGCNIKN